MLGLGNSPVYLVDDCDDIDGGARGQHVFVHAKTNTSKSGKQHKTCSSALCTIDDASYVLVIQLGPKTSECEKNVTVVSAVTGCDVTNCAITLHGFNKHASSLREAVSDS